MSPTVFRIKNYRFFFFSREEQRMHVHVTCPAGEAKYWLEPIIALSDSYGLTKKQLNELQEVVEERKNEIRKAWEKYFKR
jgi:hypothetical protein